MKKGDLRFDRYHDSIVSKLGKHDHWETYCAQKCWNQYPGKLYQQLLMKCFRWEFKVICSRLNYVTVSFNVLHEEIRSKLSKMAVSETVVLQKLVNIANVKRQ